MIPVSIKERVLAEIDERIQRTIEYENAQSRKQSDKATSAGISRITLESLRTAIEKIAE